MDAVCCGKTEGRRLSARFLINSFSVFAVGLIVALYVFRNDLYDRVQIRKWQTTDKPVEVVEVPLEDIMKAPVTLQQDDPKLIEKIRKDFLDPPSRETYALHGLTDDPSMGQSLKIREILGEKKNGFFVECGALDGEIRSNTLVFEKVYGWKGVLIEADPKNYNLVLEKQRKSWSVPACLSTVPYPNAVMFKQSFNVGKISDIDIHTSRAGYAQVQCLPIYSILLAVNTTNIDYFSLDVEGNELEVLRTVPWDKVNITTLSVEFIHGVEGKTALRSYMEQQGYKVHSEVTHPGSLANDFIFFHPKLL